MLEGIDEDGNIDAACEAAVMEELRGDSELDSKFDDIQARYDSLFIDDPHEFSFVGFKSEAERKKFISDWESAVNDLVKKINGKYVIQNDVRADKI